MNYIVILLLFLILGLSICACYYTDKKSCARRGYRRHRGSRGTLPGGGLGTEYWPMKHSPNIYVGPPKGTGYEPWNWVPYDLPPIQPYPFYYGGYPNYNYFGSSIFY